MVLWKFEQGKRSSVKWDQEHANIDPPMARASARRERKTVEGYLDGQLYLTHTLPGSITGRVGVWSKADSVVYFDDFTIKASQ